MYIYVVTARVSKVMHMHNCLSLGNGAGSSTRKVPSTVQALVDVQIRSSGRRLHETTGRLNPACHDKQALLKLWHSIAEQMVLQQYCAMAEHIIKLCSWMNKDMEDDSMINFH